MLALLRTKMLGLSGHTCWVYEGTDAGFTRTKMLDWWHRCWVYRWPQPKALPCSSIFTKIRTRLCVCLYVCSMYECMYVLREKERARERESASERERERARARAREREIEGEGQGQGEKVRGISAWCEGREVRKCCVQVRRQFCRTNANVVCQPSVK